jgi:phage terminase large subunit-like protein
VISPAPENVSLAEYISSLNENEQRQILSELTEQEADELERTWEFWARPNQLAPDGDWRVWLLLAGRGFGKTRSGAEYVRNRVESGTCRRFALVAPTAADARDVIVEGESGIKAISPHDFYPTYEPSKRRLTWPNGAIATTYSADEPDRLRGPQHDGAWCDELASWRYPEAWDMLMFGLRLGKDPRTVVTTTPKPTKLVKELIKDPATVITSGSTYENAANLAPTFLTRVVKKYEGTRLGRQELHAALLDDTPGALWTLLLIESARIRTTPDLIRIVVAVDPAVTSEEDSDETGIIVAGIDAQHHGYVIDDLSGRYSPQGWAERAVQAYHKYQADRIVAEVNNGGDMVEGTLRGIDKSVAYTGVHASRGKRVRAEPVSAFYERGEIHHVGVLAVLEDQLCTWVPGVSQASPDRLDALVWAFTELLLGDTVEIIEVLPASFTVPSLWAPMSPRSR